MAAGERGDGKRGRSREKGAPTRTGAGALSGQHPRRNVRAHAAKYAAASRSRIPTTAASKSRPGIPDGFVRRGGSVSGLSYATSARRAMLFRASMTKTGKEMKALEGAHHERVRPFLLRS